MTLATNLSGITRNTGILCQNIRGNQCGISQSLKLREKTNFRRALMIAKDETASPRKAKAVFIASSNFFFPVILMFGTHYSQGCFSCPWV